MLVFTIMWQNLVWLLTLIPSALVMLIYLAFRRVLYSKKFEMRTLLHRGETLTKYLSAYGGSKVQSQSAPGNAVTEDLVSEIVDQIFELNYSFREYLPAIIFVVLVTAGLVTVALELVGYRIGNTNFGLEGNALLKNMVAGGFGALVWSMYEFSERYRSSDLPPDAFFSMGARIIVVGAVGSLIGAFVVPHLALPVAFGLGILPMRQVRGFLTERTRKALRIPNSTKYSESPSLTLVQGYNAETADKLARAGVLSVQELACTNQFQLYLRSNLDWRVILDLSDQALLILYIGKEVEKLRPLGIRSAVELADIGWSDEDDDFYCGLDQEIALKSVASALDMTVQSVKLLVSSISADATVSFLSTLWSDDTPEDQQDEG